MNSYWEMPFRQRARLTIENLGHEDVVLYYQIDYTLTDVPADVAYFHAQWRRSNPLDTSRFIHCWMVCKEKVSMLGPILPGRRIQRAGGVRVRSNFIWMGIKTFQQFAALVQKIILVVPGTLSIPQASMACILPPFLGLHQVIKPDGLYRSQQRFGMYRWHIMDPIRFEQDLRVTIQALGWRSGGRYLPLQDDIASVAFWYQREPHAPYPALPDRDGLEVI